MAPKDIAKNCPFISSFECSFTEVSMETFPEIIERFHNLKKLCIISAGPSAFKDALPTEILRSVSYCHPNMEDLNLDFVECDGDFDGFRGLILRCRKLTRLLFTLDLEVNLTKEMIEEYRSCRCVEINKYKDSGTQRFFIDYSPLRAVLCNSCLVHLANCGKKCSKCYTVSYCSRDCQLNDWKHHRKFCSRI